MSSMSNKLIPFGDCFVVDNHLNRVTTNVNIKEKKRKRGYENENIKNTIDKINNLDSTRNNNNNNNNMDNEILINKKNTFDSFVDSITENNDEQLYNDIILTDNMKSVNLFDSKESLSDSLENLSKGLLRISSTNVELSYDNDSLSEDKPRTFGFHSETEITNESDLSDEGLENRDENEKQEQQMSFDSNDMNLQTKKFTNKFINLKDVEVYDKIQINEMEKEGYDIIEKDEASNYNPFYGFSSLRLQSLSRWWYEQNRNKTHKFIKDNFKDYFTFLNMIIFAYNSNKASRYYNAIAYENKYLIEKIKSGLLNLRITYDDCDEIKEEIQTISIFLKEFCRKVDEEMIVVTNTPIKPLLYDEKSN